MTDDEAGAYVLAVNADVATHVPEGWAVTVIISNGVGSTWMSSNAKPTEILKWVTAWAKRMLERS